MKVTIEEKQDPTLTFGTLRAGQTFRFHGSVITCMRTATGNGYVTLDTGSIGTGSTTQAVQLVEGAFIGKVV